MKEELKYTIVGITILFIIFLFISTFLEIIGMEYNRVLYWIIFIVTSLVYILKDNKDIVWHFIGHLQRNKTNKIINSIDYLHSLDSLELAHLINEKRVEPLNVFVEVSINLEETKSGIPVESARDFISEILKLEKINVVGLMMMSVKASEHNSLEEQFKKLKDLRDGLEKELNIKLPYLSMGMSDDYKEALDNGATHIRLGRILFEGYQP